MNLETFAQMCAARVPVAIVLEHRDYEQLRGALPKRPTEWDAEKMTFRGAPIVRAQFTRSYIIEDTPDGPLCHMVP